MDKIAFCSVNLIGDTITQSSAIREFKRRNPTKHVTWAMQESPMMSYMRELSGDICDIIVSTPDWDGLRNGTHFGPNVQHRYMSCNEAFRLGGGGVHMAQAYAKMIGVSLAPHEILPRSVVPERKDSWFIPNQETMVISPNSASSDKSKTTDGFSGGKVLPWVLWFQLFEKMRLAGRVRNAIFVLGPDDPVPTVAIPFLRLPLEQTVRYIYDACQFGGIYSGVDNGITHIAAGLRIPVFCVYCDAISESWASYSGFDHYRIAKVKPASCKHTDVWARWRNRL